MKITKEQLKEIIKEQIEEAPKATVGLASPAKKVTLNTVKGQIQKLVQNGFKIRGKETRGESSGIDLEKKHAPGLYERISFDTENKYEKAIWYYSITRDSVNLSFQGSGATLEEAKDNALKDAAAKMKVFAILTDIIKQP